MKKTGTAYFTVTKDNWGTTFFCNRFPKSSRVCHPADTVKTMLEITEELNKKNIDVLFKVK